MSWLSLHSYFFTLNEGIGSEEGDIFLAFLPLQSVATVLFVMLQRDLMRIRMYVYVKCRSIIRIYNYVLCAQKRIILTYLQY